MKYKDFLHKAFPDISVWERKELGTFHNFVKLLAIKFSFILYKLRISGNFLDFFALLLSIGGFYLLSLSNANFLYSIGGILIIYFHIWVDFIDGLLAKATDKSSVIGHQFDNLGCDADRFMLIVLFGIFSGNQLIIISNIFCAYVLIVFITQTRPEIIRMNRMNNLKYIYSHKLSPLGVRFMLGILPISIAYFSYAGYSLVTFGKIFSLIYSIFAVLWILICIPSQKLD